MAYITPNSDVYILKGVSLDSDYNHTLHNTSLTAQYNELIQYRKYTLNAQSYQRYGRERIRVAILADNLYDCNYMMFRNTAYGNKWFYAFIDNVTYINDNATEIHYTIDDMQTWYFDYEIGACLVEREHVMDDSIGANIVSEGFDVGELIPEADWTFYYPRLPAQPMYELVVYYVPNNDKKYITGSHLEGGNIVYDLSEVYLGNNRYSVGTIVNGIYMGCKYWGLPVMLGADVNQTRQDIDDLIATIISDQVEGKIVNIVQMPFAVWTDWFVNGQSSSIVTDTHSRTSVFYNRNHTSTYTPRNNKMYTYPYRSILVTNNGGQSAEYKWESFYTGNNNYDCTFKIESVPLPVPEVMLYPAYYRGLNKDYDSGIMFTDFPDITWSEDSFTRWWTQNKASILNSLITTGVLAIGAMIVTGGIGAGAIGAGAAGAVGGGEVAGLLGRGVLESSLVGNAGLSAGASAASATAGLGSMGKALGVGSMLNARNTIRGALGEYKQAKNTPDQFYGQLSASSMKSVQGRVGFHFYDMGVEETKARMIDDYFTMYGYAVNQLKIPNIRSGGAIRPHWNYVKTSGCVIHSASGSGLPADAEKNIASIYDRGITFWNYLSEVGDYGYNNAPT